MIERPKRRRKMDNPYYLIELDENTFYVMFKDNDGLVKNIKIDKRTFEVFNRFELDDLRELNEIDKHYDFKKLNNEYDETTIFHYIQSESLEKIVEKKILIDELYKAINSLDQLQKNRIKKYFFEDKTVYEIADEEGTTHQAISKSLDKSLRKLKKLLKNKI